MIATQLKTDEQILCSLEHIKLAIYKSLPTLHAANSIPGLHMITLVVTNFRAIIRGVILGRIQVVEFDLWYPGQYAPEDGNVLERVTMGERRMGGSYLHLLAVAPEHGPLQGDVAEIYLYVSKDEAIRIMHIMNEQMHPAPVEWR